MTLDLSYEQAFNSGELLQGLQICQQELNELEDKGLSFIEIGDDHYYLGSSFLAFLKEIEGRATAYCPENREGITADMGGKK